MKLTLKTHAGKATGRAGNLPTEELAGTPVVNRQQVIKTRKERRAAGKRRRVVGITAADFDAFKQHHQEEPLEAPSTHRPEQRSNRKPARSNRREAALEIPSTWATPRGKSK